MNAVSGAATSTRPGGRAILIALFLLALVAGGVGGYLFHAATSGSNATAQAAPAQAAPVVAPAPVSHGDRWYEGQQAAAPAPVSHGDRWYADPRAVGAQGARGSTSHGDDWYSDPR